MIGWVRREPLHVENEISFSKHEVSLAPWLRLLHLAPTFPQHAKTRWQPAHETRCAASICRSSDAPCDFAGPFSEGARPQGMVRANFQRTLGSSSDFGVLALAGLRGSGLRRPLRRGRRLRHRGSWLRRRSRSHRQPQARETVHRRLSEYFWKKKPILL